MKEHIYTIPVTEGFTDGGECPFCNMHDRLEKNALDFTLGPSSSYMEDDVRSETNEKGFCRRHFTDMYTEQNRLGLALMTHTHLKKVTAELNKLTKSMEKDASGKKPLFSKGVENNAKTAAYIGKIMNSCYVCDRVATTFDRYIDTYFYMWTNNRDIRTLTQECKGFCIRHFAMLLESGEAKLGTSGYRDFLSVILPLQQANMKRLDEELDWFIQKFDYRYTNEPWKNSKDSLHRAINKLSSAGLTE